MGYNNFIPNWTKQQFIKWAVKRFCGSKARFSNMKKKQLIAIYLN